MCIPIGVIQSCLLALVVNVVYADANDSSFAYRLGEFKDVIMAMLRGQEAEAALYRSVQGVLHHDLRHLQRGKLRQQKVTRATIEC